MILLVGVNYGSIEPRSGKSYTEVEYDYASSLKLPILVYIIDKTSPNQSVPLNAIDNKNLDQLEAFIAKLNVEHTTSPFTSIEDLGEKILHDVPAELEKTENIEVDSTGGDNLPVDVTEEDLREGANKFERFWLRPQRLAGRTVPVRIRVNKKFSGWKVKDELIRAVGCTVGDCITTEVTVQLGSGIIDDPGDTDIFADGNGADWILDQISHSKTNGVGCVIDCYVRLSYCRAPVGANNKMVNKVSIVFVKGIKYVGIDRNYVLSQKGDEESAVDLNRLLSILNS